MMPARLASKLAAMVFAASVCGATMARAEAEPGTPRWAAGQFKAIGLKPVQGAHGYVASVRTGDAGRSALVAAMLPGADPLLSRDYVLVEARLGTAGGAALIEAARALTAHPSRRSVVFVLSPAGAGARGAVTGDRIVADLDLDVAPGPAGLTLAAADETSLGRDAGELAASQGLTTARLPADASAYAARAGGVPTLSIGSTPEGTQDFAAYVAALVARVAAREERPAWAPGSRFAPPAPRAEEVLTDPVDMPLGRRPRPAVQGFG